MTIETTTTGVQIIECADDGWFAWGGKDYRVRTQWIAVFDGHPYMIDDEEQLVEPIGTGHVAEPMDLDDYRYTHGGHVYRQAVEFANERWVS